MAKHLSEGQAFPLFYGWPELPAGGAGAGWPHRCSRRSGRRFSRSSCRRGSSTR
ncbi:MAG: hypothetical protein MZV64_42195 [Ignavibacteriales bacterium]|nr:hypothetical protein [Ignavibacteriales bacterium]